MSLTKFNLAIARSKCHFRQVNGPRFMIPDGCAKVSLTIFAAVLLMSALSFGGLHSSTVSAGNVPWPGGIVPYELDASLSVAQKQTYLDGLREYELAANVKFILRTTQTPYMLFKYAPSGPNLYSLGNPQKVEINLLTRGQICHEMGHAFGLEHEHQRTNRDAFITVNYGNVIPGNNSAFDILASAVPFGNYDFESVMHYGRSVYSVAPGLDTIQTKPEYEKYQKRLSNAALSPTDRAHMAALYGPPVVPLSSVVIHTADGGVGSLRAALYYATDHPGTTITFNIPQSDPGFGNGVFTIQPTGYLPPLVTNGTIIDGSTQPGYAGKPIVFLNGAKLLPEAGSVAGLLFYESNCTVKALGFQRFPWNGISMIYPDASGNRVVGCSCGVDSVGNAAEPNAFQGIQISDGAHGNFIGGTGTNERNVISGNTQYGVWISGATTTGNTVQGNYIGTNLDGTNSLPNNVGGIILIDGANQNSIGGGTVASRNVISGNVDGGVWISGDGSDQNTVRGNYIGLNAAGTSALANTFAGVHLINAASDNTISDNIISGNSQEGVRISGTGTSGNTLYGNRVGTSPNSGSALPNGFAGVTLFAGASGNQIGGTSASQGNILSGNGSVGLAIGDSGTIGNRVYGNYIGTNASGMSALPNGFAGAWIVAGADANWIGDGPGTGNLISGNSVIGVLVADPGTTGNFIRNNRIGLDSAGGTSISNQGEGVRLANGCQSTTVGGSTPGASNIIAGNSWIGVASYNPLTAANKIQRNSISAFGWKGIALNDGSNNTPPAPALSTAVLGLGTVVTGTLSSTPNRIFTIEFFASPDSRDFLGESEVTCNGAGIASINVSLPAIVAAGRTVTATATSKISGETSEFSNSVTVTSNDGDSDGLPNAYEATIAGLSLSNPLDAVLDNDGDGFSNLQEFVAGTNPNSPASRLAAAGVILGNNYQLTFGTVVGRFYRIERSESLTGSWSPVAIHIAGTGTNVQTLLPFSTFLSRQFFRVSAGE